jgi:hypothetical protein
VLFGTIDTDIHLNAYGSSRILEKRQEIDQIEANIYIKILGAPNTISNKGILNTMTSMILAGEAITHLSRSAWQQFRK